MTNQVSVGQSTQINAAGTRTFGQCIGFALRLARSVDDVTQQQVCDQMTKMLGVPVLQSFLSKIERGEANVSWGRFYLICDILNWTPSRIVELADIVQQCPQASDAQLLKRLMRGKSGDEVFGSPPVQVDESNPGPFVGSKDIHYDEQERPDF